TKLDTSFPYTQIHTLLKGIINIHSLLECKPFIPFDLPNTSISLNQALRNSITPLFNIASLVT
ncbi:hypothetical protein RGC35_08160, partial [Helicobacter pylori]|uniref:hypothetical protein n=1 Tax=Helicobacter pylori TaxID=210 RepID=UPI002929D0F4